MTKLYEIITSKRTKNKIKSSKIESERKMNREDRVVRIKRCKQKKVGGTGNTREPAHSIWRVSTFVLYLRLKDFN